MHGFRLRGVKRNLEGVGSRKVDFGRRALQQLSNQVLGFIYIADQKFALREFESQAEH